MTTINNWCVCYPKDVSSYTPPELIPPCLGGKLENGKSIITSRIKKVNKDGTVETQNSVYKLGTVDPQWEKEYPNAKERFLANAE